WIPSENRRDFLMREDRVVPAGHRIERYIEPRVARHLPERCNMLGAAQRPGQVVFVFDLNADHGSAVLPQLAFELLADLAVIPLDVTQINRVIRTGRHLIDDPLGHTAIANFRVSPGPDTHERL